MRINALCFVMIMVVWTPFGLEEEHIEIEVSMLGKQMVYQPDFYIFNRVCE